MNNEKIGALIAQLRKEKGLTQQELAERLHLSNKTVSKWECGQGAPDASVWDTLADVLGGIYKSFCKGSLRQKSRMWAELISCAFMCARAVAILSPPPPRGNFLLWQTLRAAYCGDGGGGGQANH